MELDGQTDSVKKNRIRLSVVNLSAFAGSELRLTARRIQSKRTEFVCPSLSIRALSLARNCLNPSAVAGSELRSTARRISQKEQNLSVRRQHPLSSTYGSEHESSTWQKWRERLVSSFAFVTRRTKHPYLCGVMKVDRLQTEFVIDYLSLLLSPFNLPIAPNI